ncbi:hypothetical protein VIGAN_01105600 [Vigna angularis var. angularis]|uniref:Sulfite exporter TauE/SafE family protein n=1 Tax=Vigna angularis var. angularis TaxID=157739 RepID=A0A0S3QZ33_PHAAN|nr:hypothetical protein VIGAN_01105600 [Vigna angularis var. angularis]
MGLLEASQRWHAKWFSGKVLIAVLLLVTVSAENNSSQSNDSVGVHNNAKVFYNHTWPSMKFGWRIIVGSIVGFLGSAFGNIGGIGGGGIFVPMLTLIIGFDTKSAIAISKYIATAKDAAHYIQTEDPVKDDTKELKKKVSMVDNIRWKDLGHLFAVWIMILALEIGKIPIAVGMSSYQAMRLYKGKRSIASKGDKQPRWRVWQLILFCCCGTLAGTLAGLLGLGGGFILAPLFLGIGIPPQVASATSILAMAFSASMAVVEYYLLKRFPIHYGGVGVVHMIQKIERKEHMGFGNLCMYTAKN